MGESVAAIAADPIRDKPILDMRDMTALFQTSSKTIDRWVQAKKLPPPMKPGGRRCLWRREAVMEAIERLEREAAKRVK